MAATPVTAGFVRLSPVVGRSFRGLTTGAVVVLGAEVVTEALGDGDALAVTLGLGLGDSSTQAEGFTQV